MKDLLQSDPRQTGVEIARVLIVLAEAERGDAIYRSRSLALAPGQAGVAVTITSCLGPIPVSDRVMRAVDRCGAGLDLAPHLLDFEDTVSHLSTQLAFFDAVVTFQDVADIYPALDHVHARPLLIEVGATAT